MPGLRLPWRAFSPLRMCNGVAVLPGHRTTKKPALAPPQRKNQWARRDLNPRSPGYEPGAMTGLAYGPHNNPLNPMDAETPLTPALLRIPEISSAHKLHLFTINTLCGADQRPPPAGTTTSSASRMTPRTSCRFSSIRLSVSASRFSRTTGSVWERRMLNHHAG